MRRLLKHAAVGVGFSAAVVSAAVAGLGSPAVESSAIAVPVPAITASADPTAAPSGYETDADRAAREAEETRSATRDQLAATTSQAVKRASALEEESRSISRQQTKIVAAKKAAAAAEKKRVAAAKAKAAAEAAAKAKRVSEQGYEPGTTDPREMAKQILDNKFNYGSDQFSCFNNIIIRESNWDVNATNASSGAYGIPQALPGTKMASVASDWRTNPATQIIWGVQYMKSRYGSPCAAWGFKSSHGWY